jgi:hypothetical protein
MKFVLMLTAFLGSSPLLPAQSSVCPAFPSHISIESGVFSSQPGVTFRLRHFVATLVPLGKSAPSCYTKMTVVSHAEIFVSNESLTKVFAEKLGAAKNKIRGFKVENGEGKVTLTGKINKVIPIEFTIEGPVTTDGTSILLDANKIKADGIPVKALLSIVGEHLSSVLGLNGVSGVTVRENRISFSPEQVAHLKGYIESVQTSPQGLLLQYGKTPSPHH